MEQFFAGLSGTLGILGSMAVFFVLQRKDTRQLVDDLKGMILRESDRQEANTQRVEANTQKVADDLKETRTHLENKIEKQADDLKETRTHLEGVIEKQADRQEANTQKVVDDLKETRTHLEGVIEKEADRLEAGTQRVEDQLQTVDDRVREVEGDMKVVKHQLQIPDGHPVPPEPAQPSPVPSDPVPDNPERPLSLAAPAPVEK